MTVTPSAAAPAAPVCLGIEAGGTRTVAIAAGPGPDPPVRREFGPANLFLLDERQLTQRLRTIARAMPSPDAIAIGMAGARTDGDRARVRAAAAVAWPGVSCHATNDLETALMAAPAAAWPRRGPRAERRPIDVRVAIVSGTGSCCFGRGADGRTARVGGWGHVLGDRGSGYDIVVRALRAIVHDSDRAGRWPALGRRMLRALVLNEPHDLAAWVQRASKAEVAAQAPEVFAAAAQRDRLALEVLDAAAESLASDAAACARMVSRRGTPVQFVLAGSVLLKQPRFAARVGRAMRRLWPSAVVTPLEAESAWGAVELARQRLALAPFAAPPDGAVGAHSTSAPSLRALRRSPTELRNPRSANLDRLSVADAVTLMLTEDRAVPEALLAQRDAIARGVKLIARAFARGGRLFYAGAGTSGRLGVLDASECPPTFRTPPDMVQGIIAGGQAALWSSVEGAEDDAAAGGQAIAAHGVARLDVVVGIAASGRTPFVWGALAEARRRGAATVLLCFNPHLAIARSDRPTVVIAPDVGPEVLTGSTRLKAGTATKLVLNIFTTLSMVTLGKVRSNLMIDMKPSNVKLRDRAVRIVEELTGANQQDARSALEKSRWDVRRACASFEQGWRGRPAPPPVPSRR